MAGPVGPLQVPNLGWQPVPQWPEEEPQKTHSEQQSPKADPRQVCWRAEPQSPEGEMVRVGVGAVEVLLVEELGVGVLVELGVGK